jgi:hypothetical protein
LLSLHILLRLQPFQQLTDGLSTDDNLAVYDADYSENKYIVVAASQLGDE